MRILVVSDTHGDIRNLAEVIRINSTAEVVIHCGDGADELEEAKRMFPDRMFISVRGNCDFCTQSPYTETIILEGKKIFVTHGHLYSVKSDLLKLSLGAKENGADVVLFGHTHMPLELYQSGVYYLNPGSLRGYGGSYLLLEISPSGIMTRILHLGG